jgi:hypothetical protein
MASCKLVIQASKLLKISRKRSKYLCIGIAAVLGLKKEFLSRNSSFASREVRSKIRQPIFIDAVLLGRTDEELIELAKPVKRTSEVPSIILVDPKVKISRVGLGKGAHAIIYS